MNRDARKQSDAERRGESKRILEKIASESETIGGSGFARTASRIADHFKANENPDDDRIEIVGKRIARALSAIAFVALLIYLLATYGTPR